MRKITWVFIAIALGVWYYNTKTEHKSTEPAAPPAATQSKN